MSKKAEEAKPASEESQEKPEETQSAPEKSEEKPVEAQEKAAETAKTSAKAEEKPAKAEKKPAAAKKKPLEKMTVKDLREAAKDIPGITGVHAMKKDELIVEIKKAKGIVDEPVKKADASISELKQKIKGLKVERQAALEAKDRKKATIFKRRISRLKKKTRRVAA
jgi:hypothetical protein